ncbi:MAG: PHP domain-containing protein [Anaerolineaceae bacterium]|nr:PHP domain-containing protein [Anaerolineaceae bacterium]
MPSDQQGVDLHIHSTASDGALAPGEIVGLAAEIGLRAIALTDHDTASGVGEALEAGRRAGLEVLTGVEISAEFPEGTMHILGYGFDPQDDGLKEALAQFRRNRDERNPRILARLAELGVPVSLETVREKATGQTVGRPHIAQCLVEAGHVASVDEAFRLYLGRGAAAYVNRRRATAEEAIRMIHGAGGLAVLAHPMQLRRPMLEIRRTVRELAARGLDGLEAWHPDHSTDDTRTFEVLARELDLVVTGGTDFHGSLRREVRLGVGRGNIRTTYEAVRAIRRRLAGQGR